MSSVYGQTLLDDMVKRQGLPLPLVKQAANDILELIREGLARDGVVSVSHFGTFRLKAVAARQGVNPQTREPITIPAHQRVIFSPCKALRELIQPEHPPVIPIDATRGTERAAARTAPIVPVASKRITPEPLSEAAGPTPPAEVIAVTTPVDAAPTPAQPEPAGQSTPTATDRTAAVTAQTASLTESSAATPPPAKAVPSSVTETAVTPAAAPAAQIEGRPTAVHSIVEGEEEETRRQTIELEQEFTPAPSTTRRNGYLLGAATLLVLTLIAINQVRHEPDNAEPMAPPATKPESIPAPKPPVARMTPPRPAVVTETPEAQAESELPQPATPPVARVTLPQPEATTEESAARLASEPPPQTAPAQASQTPTTTEEAARTTSAEPPAKPAADSHFFFSEQRYTMSSGESLWRLARRFYHAPLLWPHIYQANAAIISNPDNLRTGQAIVIPTLQGTPDKLTLTDRRNIAEGYYLTYLHYKRVGHKDAFFALLEAKRYDHKVVEEHRGEFKLSKVEEILLGRQETMPF